MHIPQFIQNITGSNASEGMTEEQKQKILDAIAAQTSNAAPALTYTAPPAQEPKPADIQPTYDPVNAGPDAVLPGMRPITSMADRYTADAVPEDLQPTYTPPATSVPTAAPSNEAYPVYGQHKIGQSPYVKGAEGGTAQQNDEVYLKALNAYRPTDHNGRLKSAAINAGRRYLRGGGLIGAITGAVEGAVDPGVDERYQNEKDIGKTQRGLQFTYEREKQVNDQQNDQSTRNLHDAQAVKALQPPTYAPQAQHIIETTNGYIVYDPNLKKSVILRDPVNGEQAKKMSNDEELVQDPANPRVWRVFRNGKPTARTVVRDPKYGDIPSGAARTADATENNQAQTHQRQATQDTLHVSERTEDKTNAAIDKGDTRTREAAQHTGALDGARKKWMDIDAKLNDPVSGLYVRLAKAVTPGDKQNIQDKIDEWEYQKTAAAEDATRAASQLQTGFGDMIEAGPGERGLAYWKWRPFSTKQLKARVKGITPERIDAAKQAAKDRGQPVID